jgi:hypothetical protein
MPGFLLHVGAGVQCIHGAPATLTTTNVRVLVSGSPAVTVADLTLVAGCPFVPVKPQPCVRITWMASARVLINGSPAVFQLPGPGLGFCLGPEQAPQGVPIVSMIQGRVSGI